MANINSPLGNSNIQGKPAQHFTVSDESPGAQQRNFSNTNYQEPPRPQNTQPYQRPQQAPPQQGPQIYSSENMSADEVWAMREQIIENRRQQHNQTLGADKRRLEILIGIGREYRDVELNTNEGRVVFKLQTIKARERQHVAKMLNQLFKQRTNENLHALRDTTLAYAIDSIDGISLDNLLNCENMNEDDKYYIRESFIREMDDNVSLFLYKNFEILDEESKSRYTWGTEDGAKEVAEAISKSNG